MTLDLDPCDPKARCSDCNEPADGLRKNLDHLPTCRMCEANRMALISLIIKASKPAPDQLQIWCEEPAP